MKHKETWISLLLYLLMAFGFTWILMICYWTIGGNSYSLDVGNATQLLLSFSMMMPALSVILTRLIRKEGLKVTGEDSLMLGISLEKKKFAWLLLAIFLPWFYMEVWCLIVLAFNPQAFTTSMLEEIGLPVGFVWLIPLYGLISALINSFGGLGEEIGWRAYMMPKLEKIMGVGPAIVVGGIIWGAWHYPAIYYGHNFGTDYWGAPWSGFLVFTLYTIAMNAILTLVVKKTGSVWSAAFLHAVNNQMSASNAAGCFIDNEKLDGIWTESTVLFGIGGSVVLVLGIIAAIWLCKEEKKKKAET